MIMRNPAVRLSVLSLLAGLTIAVLWSFQVADDVIGQNLARTLLNGVDARSVDLTAGSALGGLLFAVISGVATTFTACNCVVFSCLVPLAEPGERRALVLRNLGWMALGVLVVTGLYGLAGALFGTAIPALSDAVLPIGPAGGYPVRLAQSTFIFVLLGGFLIWWGLATAGVLPNPLDRLFDRRLWLRPLLLGVLNGLFAVGRPMPLFRKLFAYSSGTGDALLGSGAVALHGLGAILIMAALLLLLSYTGGGRFGRWLQASPQRMRNVTAASMIVGGAFFLFYWGVRVPSYYGIGWFPHMPYR